jgi:hypothetical protein
MKKNKHEFTKYFLFGFITVNLNTVNLIAVLKPNGNESACAVKKDCYIEEDYNGGTDLTDYSILDYEYSETSEYCCIRCWDLQPNCTVFAYSKENFACIYFTNLAWSDVFTYPENGTSFGVPLTEPNYYYYYYYY